MTVKAEFKEFIGKLIALDMNVIVTSREKTKYKEGSFMEAIGKTFDGEKSLPYIFDTIVRMYVDKKGQYQGFYIKERSNKLPKEDFECFYKTLEKFFRKQDLNREVSPIKYATTQQKEKIRRFIEQFKMTPEQVANRLATYDAESIDDLTFQNADVIISKFESVIASKCNARKKEVQNA